MRSNVVSIFQLYRDSKILTAVWNADTCSLAVATAAGGVDIYDILPNHPSVLSETGSRGSTDTATREAAAGAGNKEKQQQTGPGPATSVSVSVPPQSRPLAVVLRHKIVIKTISSTPSGGRKAVSRPVKVLATSSNDCSWDSSGGGGSRGKENDGETTPTAAGAGILVGVAEGKHLCIWDLATGSTLLTALSMAPTGCKVEKVLWYGPTALVALLYYHGVGVTRIDVHQVDVANEATIPVGGAFPRVSMFRPVT